MKQPRVAFFGGPFTAEDKTVIEKTSEPFYFEDDQNLETILFDYQPDILVSVGSSCSTFPKLLNSSLSQRKRWLHYDSGASVAQKMTELYICFISHIVNLNEGDGLITVFTTSYKSGDYILRPFNSLRNQTYQNWEWVIFDDTDGDENFATLKRLKDQDRRIRIYRTDGNSGIIGNVKNLASSLARGEILIEVDHDDDLTPWALQKTYDAFKEFPDAGFAYSDFSEIFEDGRNFSYGEHFAIGYGSYRKEYYNNKWRNVFCSAPINSLTIRYIVGSPNHLRAWRKKTLNEIGGWNPYLHVADDYEIMLRTFLKTKMIRIPHLCYLQYRNTGGNNYTFIRNAEIQKLVAVLSTFYNKKVHDRILDMNEIDEYYENWKDYPKFGKSWLNPLFEKQFNYISGLNDKLISIVIIADNLTNQAELMLRVNLVLANTYTLKEILVIGLNCDWLESALDSSNNINLKWWNLQEGTFVDAMNYATKMVAIGGIIAYWVNDFKQRDYLNNLQEEFKNPETIWSTNCHAHRSNIFKQIGYWPKNTDSPKSFYNYWINQTKNDSSTTTEIGTIPTEDLNGIVDQNKMSFYIKIGDGCAFPQLG